MNSTRVKKVFLIKFLTAYLKEITKTDIDEKIKIKVLTEKEIAGLQHLRGYVLFNLNKKF